MSIDNIKNKIALVADVRNWAFHNIAKQICHNLNDTYDFEIFFACDYPDITFLWNELLNYDLVHFFWRDYFYSLFSNDTQQVLSSKGIDYKYFVNRVIDETKVTSSVCDHLFLSEQEIQNRQFLFGVLLDGYTVTSDKLLSIYKSIDNYLNPTALIEDAVDLAKFYPRDIERIQKHKKEIVVGWAGNSKWGGDGKDHKGLNTLLKPAIDSLREEGLCIRGVYADREEEWIPHDKMIDYYNSIDIYVCVSDIEGTPNPVLEAMACGLPIISTNVGIVPQVFGNLQTEFILPTRNIESLKGKIRLLVKDPKTRKLLSDENLQSIQSWTCESMSKKWHKFFQDMLKPSQSQYEWNRLRRILLNFYIDILVSNQAKDSEIYVLRQEILAMQSSKFWLIRKYWLRLKKFLCLNKSDL